MNALSIKYRLISSAEKEINLMRWKSCKIKMATKGEKANEKEKKRKRERNHLYSM